jgi:hypothetical protein
MQEILSLHRDRALTGPEEVRLQAGSQSVRQRDRRNAMQTLARTAAAELMMQIHGITAFSGLFATAGARRNRRQGAVER